MKKVGKNEISKWAQPNIFFPYLHDNLWVFRGEFFFQHFNGSCEDISRSSSMALADTIDFSHVIREPSELDECSADTFSCRSCANLGKRCLPKPRHPSVPCDNCIAKHGSKAAPAHCFSSSSSASATTTRGKKRQSKNKRKRRMPRQKKRKNPKKTRGRKKEKLIPLKEQEADLPGCDSTATSPADFRDRGNKPASLLQCSEEEEHEDVSNLLRADSKENAMVPPSLLLSTTQVEYDPEDTSQLPSVAADMNSLLGEDEFSSFNLQQRVPTVANIHHLLHQIDPDLLIPREVDGHTVVNDTIHFNVLCISLNGKQEEIRYSVTDRNWMSQFTSVWSRLSKKLPPSYTANTLYDLLWSPVRSIYIHANAEELPEDHEEMTKDQFTFGRYIQKVCQEDFRKCWERHFELSRHHCGLTSSLVGRVENFERKSLQRYNELLSKLPPEQSRVTKKFDRTMCSASKAARQEVVSAVTEGPPKPIPKKGQKTFSGGDAIKLAKSREKIHSNGAWNVAGKTPKKAYLTDSS